MKLLKTEGIILLRKPYQENKVRLEILTKELGRCSVLWRAGSGRRLWSGLLEPTHHLNLMLYPGHSFYTVTGCELLTSFPDFRSNYQKFSDAIKAIQIIRGITFMDQENEALFDALLDFLKTLNLSSEEALLEQFRLKILQLEGILPFQVSVNEAMGLLEDYAGKKMI